MVTVSQQQAERRWDTLPETLREVLVSETSMELIDAIVERQNLDAQQEQNLMRVSGFVIFGFLRPEPAQVARELQDHVGLDEATSLSIADELQKKLFDPIADELARVYAPPSSSEEDTVPAMSPIASPESAGARRGAPLEPVREEDEHDLAEVDDATPFLLHTEDASPVESADAQEKPSVSFRPAIEQKPKPKKQAVTVRVEGPLEEEPALKQESAPQRVVHYSNLRTSLSDAKDANKNANDAK